MITAIDSPIHKKLVDALMMEGHERGAYFELFNEFRIKAYFADILIVHEGGQRLVIECDGHEYHSQKDDKAYDAKRDRDLLMEGYVTIRFTGREIHYRATQCASEVFDLLERWPI